MNASKIRIRGRFRNEGTLTAKEYFEQIRETAARYRRVYDRIRQRRELGGAPGKTGNIGTTSHSIMPDAMARDVANLIEREPRDFAELHELKKGINEAIDVIKAIHQQFGPLQARLLYRRYIKGESVGQTAKACGVPKSTAYFVIQQTFGKIDRHGFGILRTMAAASGTPETPDETHPGQRFKETPGKSL